MKNRKHIRKSLYSGLYTIILLTASCGESFNPDIDTTPVAVLNVLVEPDSVVTASVTRSFYLESEVVSGDSTTLFLKDASVTLSVNGEDKGEMAYDGATRKFRSAVKVSPSDDVRVSVRSEQFGTAEGSTNVPQKIEGSRWSCVMTWEKDFNTTMVAPDGTISHPVEPISNYSITFRDPADTDNYYLVVADGNLWNYIEYDDPILGNLNSPLDAVFSNDKDLAIFLDKEIAGKEYTFNLKFPNSRWGNPDRLVNIVTLYSISEDYYRYLLSIFKKYYGLNGTLENLGVAYPKFVYSNVSPGVGIVASQTPVCRIVNDVTDIIEAGPEKEI